MFNIFDEAIKAGMVRKPAMAEPTGYIPSVISNPEQYRKSQSASQIQSPAFQASSNPPTDEELKKMIDSGLSDEQIIALFPTETPKEEQSFFGGALEKTMESAKSGFGRIGEAGVGLAEGKYNLPEAAIRGAAGSLETAFSPLSGVLGQGLQEGIEELSPETKKSVSEFVSPKIQELKQWYGSQSPEQKRRLENLGVGVEVLANFVGGKAAQKTGEKVLAGAGTAGKKATETVSKTGMKVPKISEKLAEKGQDFLYEAVNPTTRENKAILRKRVEDLVPYIENNPLKNSLEQVKTRVDIDKNNALDNMKLYEERIGVKGKLNVVPIEQKLENEFMKKTSKGVLVNEDEAKMAQQMIAKLDELGPVIADNDIILLRRAWDKIIDANKGFMLTADAKTKGNIFETANRFLREEIRKSNPEYAKYLEKAHKTITLSDVLDATILRRAGQTKGGFIRRGLENTARVTGATVGGIPGYLASEALIQGSELVSGAAAKLTAGKLLFNKGKNGIRGNVGGIADNNVLKGVSGLKAPKVTPPKTPNVLSPKGKTQPSGQSKNPIKGVAVPKPATPAPVVPKPAVGKTPIIGLTEKGGVKNVLPGNQVKYNQGNGYEPVRMVLTDRDADIARWGALQNKGMKTPSSSIYSEMKSIENRLKKDGMERTDIQNRVQEIKDIAKNARSKTESVLVDLRKTTPSGQAKNPIKGSVFDLTDKRGSIKLPGKVDIPDIVKNTDDLKKIGTGSDRNVYELSDGSVLKVAKSGRGLVQNLGYDSELANAGVIPKAKKIGKNYIQTEKITTFDNAIPKERDIIDEFVSRVSGMGNASFRDNGAINEYALKDLKSILREYGMGALADRPNEYLKNVSWGDINLDNVGIRNGKPIIIDEGVLNYRMLKKMEKGETGGLKEFEKKFESYKK